MQPQGEEFELLIEDLEIEYRRRSDEDENGEDPPTTKSDRRAERA